MQYQQIGKREKSIMERTYQKHFVVFMDILGYKNLVIEADKKKKTALKVIDKLEHMIKKCIKGAMKEMEKYSFFNIEYILFSDSLCIFAPIDEGEEGDRLDKYKGHSQKYVENNYIRLWILCRLIADIQLESLQFGIIYRGAISLGNHFHSKNITFSKALIDAYLAESTEAIYPRIIILNTPENDILELAPIIYEYFDLRVVADDDYLFVDYLGKVVEFYDLLGGDCDYIKWHKKIIEKGIESFLNTEKILRKYAWMMNYHHSKLAPIFGTEICVKNELKNKVIQKLGLHLIDFLG